MRKRLIFATLIIGLPCVLEVTQLSELFGAGRLVYLHSADNVFGWKTALNGRLQSTRNGWKTLDRMPALDRSGQACSNRELIFTEFLTRSQHGHEVQIWQLPNSESFFFVSGMVIDADGAPNAYNSHDTGLDELANAGVPGHWNGIVTDREGNPLVQQQNDPFPGYYVSCTALFDPNKPFVDPNRYVDASRIPYVAIPEDVASRGGARLGDFALVINLRNRKWSFAIYADIGTLGEGSVALADTLGIWSDAREGGVSGGVVYLVFSGSGNRKPRTISEIKNRGAVLLRDWGGMERLSSCLRTSDPAGYRRQEPADDRMRSDTSTN